jgi:hypothetical protein
MWRTLNRAQKLSIVDKVVPKTLHHMIPKSCLYKMQMLGEGPI